MNKHIKGSIAVCFLFLMHGLVLGQSSSAQQTVKVSREGAVVNGKYGAIVSPKGTVFTVQKKVDAAYEISGELFGSEISGTISEKDVELISESPASGPGNSKTSESSEPSSQPATPKVARENISYLGRSRSPELMDFFYEKIKSENVLKNIGSRDITLKEKIVVVDSIDDCPSLAAGTIVRLEGQIDDIAEGCYVLAIYNETHMNMNRRVVLFPKNMNEKPSRKTFKEFVAFTPDAKSKAPVSGIDFFFTEKDPQELIFSKDEFMNSLGQGTQYQLKCPKCDGKGSKKDLKNRTQRCITCQGNGLLSTEATFNYVDQEFKKIKK